MSISYFLQKEVDGKVATVIEITDKQLDIIYDGLRAIQDDIQDSDSPYYDKVEDDALLDLFNNLWSIVK